MNGSGTGAEVVCLGGLVLDRRMRSRAPVVPATSNPATVGLAAGGVASNVATALARQGVPAALVSCVGEDDAGRFLLDRVAAAGVDVGGVRTVPGASTAQYLAFLQPNGELFVAAAAMDVLEAIDLGDVRAAWPQGAARVFAETNLRAEVLTAVIALARETGVPLVVDAVSVPKAARLPQDLHGVDILFCNLDEARMLAGGESLPAHDAAGALRTRGARAVVVTLGADGVVVLDGDRAPVHVPGVPVSVRDVTGAGDTLVATCLGTSLRGAELSEAVAAGVVAAARVIGGPRVIGG